MLSDGFKDVFDNGNAKKRIKIKGKHSPKVIEWPFRITRCNRMPLARDNFASSTISLVTYSYPRHFGTLQAPKAWKCQALMCESMHGRAG